MARRRVPRLDGLRFPGSRSRQVLTWERTLDRPQVVAHRGASSDIAEHTLAAYEQALSDGADGVECDVRLTADGHLVCVHDRRIDRTSSGAGLVSTMQLEELERLDWSSWKSPATDRVEKELDDEMRRGTVLTLDRLLSTVRDWGRPVDVAIETKHPTRYAGLVERRLIELLHRYGWARPRHGASSPVRVMSFSWMSIRRCLEMAPELEMVYLMDRVPLRFRGGSLPLGADSAGPSMEVVRAHPEYVAKAHSAGHQVHVWTVNSPADLELCADLAVDVIVTDNPADAIRRLAEHGR